MNRTAEVPEQWLEGLIENANILKDAIDAHITMPGDGADINLIGWAVQLVGYASSAKAFITKDEET